jgi:hypothetical protein
MDRWEFIITDVNIKFFPTNTSNLLLPRYLLLFLCVGWHHGSAGDARGAAPSIGTAQW